jgi:hypothetical protein
LASNVTDVSESQDENLHSQFTAKNDGIPSPQREKSLVTSHEHRAIPPTLILDDKRLVQRAEFEMRQMERSVINRQDFDNSRDYDVLRIILHL